MYSLVDEFYFKENIQIGYVISSIQFVYESLEILRHLGVKFGDFKLGLSWDLFPLCRTWSQQMNWAK